MIRSAILSLAAVLCGSSLSAQSIGDLYRVTSAASAVQSEFHQVTVPKGAEVVLADLKGPGKITYFYITDDSAGRWYPGLVLKIYWDDASEPSIQAPVADFFGAIGGKEADYASVAMQINHACFMCYLPMPYAQRARIVLANDGDQDYSRKVAFGIDHEDSPAYAAESSRLHCQWRRSNPVRDGVHTLLEAHGPGHYVGSILQTVSRSPGVWFGEGDTQFVLDGKSMTHSPGSEDEYGSCWEDPRWRTFSSPLCGHPLNQDGVNRMYRWYLANPVRFKQSLTVRIQNQHENGRPAPVEEADDYISVAFWYQQGAAAVPLASFAERTAAPFSAGK